MNDDDLKASEGSGNSLNDKHTEQNNTLSTVKDDVSDYTILWQEIRRVNKRHHKFRKELDRLGVAQLIILLLLIGDLIITGILIYIIL